MRARSPRRKVRECLRSLDKRKDHLQPQQRRDKRMALVMAERILKEMNRKASC